MSTTLDVNQGWKTVYGYVVAVKGSSPKRAPAFAVQLHVPAASAKERLQWFSTYEVRDNRELVWVSLLRDAMVHALPVAVSYDGLRNIIAIELHSTIFHGEGEKFSATGKVMRISVHEFGLWEKDLDIPDTASIVLDTSPPLSLVLSLQSRAKETTLAQLDMLRSAYESQTEVTITYQKTPVMGAPAATANLIVGVQVGAKVVVMPKMPGNKRKAKGGVP